MTFTSVEFVVFAALFFPVYFLTMNSLRVSNAVVVAGSLIFYGANSPRFVLFMLASAVTDFGLALLINAAEDDRKRKLLLLLSVLVNIGFLSYFKYFSFFAETVSDVTKALGGSGFDVFGRVILPAGVSFYTFQSMSYTIDVYLRRIRPTWSLLEFVGFVSFFPHLVAGPIMRAATLLPQMQQARRFDLAKAEDGARQALWGFAKKIIVADNLARAVDLAYSAPESFSAMSLAIATVFFAFQIYADFSAYSDIAIGLAKILGFDLARNFKYPYFSASPIEFWRRWHITLNTWFRDYVFIPLGGSRAGLARWMGNVFTVFLISGLWHGANFTFIVWGALHGALYVAWSMWERRRAPGARRFPAAGGLVTFVLVCFAWTFFRAPDLGAALTILGKFASPSQWAFEKGFFSTGGVREGLWIIGGLLTVEWASRHKEHPLAAAGWPAWLRRPVYVALTLGIILYGAENDPMFMYFQF
jgi:alginate O-acetyltransferase complex protein AlgI